MPQRRRLSSRSPLLCRSDGLSSSTTTVALLTTLLHGASHDGHLLLDPQNRQFAIRRGSDEAKRAQLLEALIRPAVQSYTYRIEPTTLDLLSKKPREYAA